MLTEDILKNIMMPTVLNRMLCANRCLSTGAVCGTC